MKLHELKPARGHRRPAKRVGRGDGSGHGTFSGRGVKGQRSRSGGKSRLPGFEGGQTPLWKKLPKRGFHNFTHREYAWVNVETLQTHFADGEEVTPQVLKARGLVKQLKDGIKVLGRGQLSKRLIVHAHAFSARAREQIEAAGGQALTLAAEPAASGQSEG